LSDQLRADLFKMNESPPRAEPSNSISGIVGSFVEQLDVFKGWERLIHRDIEASK
jgi:hypothetical protein